jgi:hypothetical protein
MSLGKQLVNFITCDCESSAPFFVIYKAGREPTPHEIAEILLKVALNTKNQNQSIKSIRCTFCKISIEFYSTSTEAPFGQLNPFEICYKRTTA